MGCPRFAARSSVRYWKRSVKAMHPPYRGYPYHQVNLRAPLALADTPLPEYVLLLNTSTRTISCESTRVPASRKAQLKAPPTKGSPEHTKDHPVLPRGLRMAQPCGKYSCAAVGRWDHGLLAAVNSLERPLRWYGKDGVFRVSAWTRAS